MKWLLRRESATRTVLIVSTLLISWLGMMVVHEAGHVIAAWASGGTVTAVVLHPLQISRTDVQPNPHPLLVVWGGPIVGTLAPLLLWGVVHRQGWAWAYLGRFFAGFCCVANGAYIGAGIVIPVGDAQTMLAHGAPTWLLGAFGLTTVILGLQMWHGQGRHFGLGRDGQAVNPRHAAWLCGLLVLLILVERSFWRTGPDP